MQFNTSKDDDEDGRNKCFQRAGGCCEPVADVSIAHPF